MRDDKRFGAAQFMRDYITAWYCWQKLWLLRNVNEKWTGLHCRLLGNYV